MAQERITIFGNLIETGDLPTMASSLMSPCRLIGMDFSVGAVDQLRITSGTCLLPNGILVLESEVKTLLIQNSNASADYTVVYQLEDTTVLGGSPAQLRLVPGVLRQSALTDATVLGWIRYPGGSVPLADAHLSQPSRLRVQPRTGEFYRSWQAPLGDAIRPPTEMPGRPLPRLVTLPSLQNTTSQTISFGSYPVRVLDVTIRASANMGGSATPFGTYTIRNGATALFGFDTRPSPTGQGGLTAGQSQSMVRLSTQVDRFIVPPNQTITIDTAWTGASSEVAGEILLTVEVPASSGNWSEDLMTVGGETLIRFRNVSGTTHTYRLVLPFTIPASGQCRKLVSRLLVDFSCIVTFSLQIGTSTVTLNPYGGQISNTGNVLTSEFNIPVLTDVSWVGGTTGSLLIDINAQPGRAAALAYAALVQESSPFLLFT